jgi:hypothetical protein
MTYPPCSRGIKPPPPRPRAPPGGPPRPPRPLPRSGPPRPLPRSPPLCMVLWEMVEKNEETGKRESGNDEDKGCGVRSAERDSSVSCDSVITNFHVMLNVQSAWLCVAGLLHVMACMRAWTHAHTSALHTMYDCNVLFASKAPLFLSISAVSPLLTNIYPLYKPSPLQPRAHEPGAPTPVTRSKRCLIANPSWPPHPCHPFLLSTSDTFLSS